MWETKTETGKRTTIKLLLGEPRFWPKDSPRKCPFVEVCCLTGRPAFAKSYYLDSNRSLEMGRRLVRTRTTWSGTGGPRISTTVCNTALIPSSRFFLYLIWHMSMLLKKYFNQRFKILNSWARAVTRWQSTQGKKIHYKPQYPWDPGSDLLCVYITSSAHQNK